MTILDDFLIVVLLCALLGAGFVLVLAIYSFFKKPLPRDPELPPYPHGKVVVMLRWNNGVLEQGLAYCGRFGPDVPEKWEPVPSVAMNAAPKDKS